MSLLQPQYHVQPELRRDTVNSDHFETLTLSPYDVHLENKTSVNSAFEGGICDTMQ